jgi:Ribonuclease G/E
MDAMGSIPALDASFDEIGDRRHGLLAFDHVPRPGCASFSRSVDQTEAR